MEEKKRQQSNGHGINLVKADSRQHTIPEESLHLNDKSICVVVKKTAVVEKYECSVIDIWAFGIVIVIGGDFFSWNAGLQSGIGSMAISTFFTGTGYLAFIFCTSELFSGLPFSGGAYGVVRCVFGFLPGFLIGFSEAVEYLAYVSMSAFTLVSLIGVLIPLNSASFHILLITFYVLASILHIFVGKTFWRGNTFLGIVSFLTVLLYCFGTLQWTRPERLGASDLQWFVGGIHGFLNCFPLPTWFFIGVEALSFAAPDTKSPKATIPRASVACVITLVFTGVFVLFVSSAAPHGSNKLSNQGFPLNVGFSLIFGCSYNTAAVLSFPATFATAFGFIFAYSCLLCGLSESGLLPPLLALKNSKGVPYAAIMIGSLVSYGLSLLIYFVPIAGVYMCQICFLSAYITYTCQCVAYIYITKKFPNIKCTFKSPLGIFGAVYSILIFVVAAVSISFFQGNNTFCLPSLLIMWTVFSLYYFLVAKNKQKFSDDEQRSVLVAHTLKYNYRKRRRRKKLFRAAVSSVVISVRPVLEHLQSKDSDIGARSSHRNQSSNNKLRATSIHSSRWDLSPKASSLQHSKFA